VVARRIEEAVAAVGDRERVINLAYHGARAERLATSQLPHPL
jgi:hypothetical protein